MALLSPDQNPGECPAVCEQGLMLDTALPPTPPPPITVSQTASACVTSSAPGTHVGKHVYSLRKVRIQTHWRVYGGSPFVGREAVGVSQTRAGPQSRAGQRLSLGAGETLWEAACWGCC